MIGVVGKGASSAFDRLDGAFGLPHPWMRTALHMLGAPRMKFPPSPAYMCFYGGVGLCVLAAWLAVEQRGLASGAMNVATMLGQSSLFMFVLQFYLFYTLLHLARPYLPFAGAWPVYLLLCVLAVGLSAVVWHRRGYRRFLAVGFVTWYEHRPLQHFRTRQVPIPSRLSVGAAVPWSD
jgi:hypothetical protein